MSAPPLNDSVHTRGKYSSGMRLPLGSFEDQNGNAFPVSSSSSSSSSSCLGESSPDSMRSLSSLSGGRTDSPLDYDIFEVTVTTTVVTTQDDPAGVAVAKWSSKEDRGDGNYKANLPGSLSMATEPPESNDNSVSVYLDASSGECCDTWKEDYPILALHLATSGNSICDDDKRSNRSGVGQSAGSDSDATEIPDDDGYDEDEDDEALFLSVSSNQALRRISMTPTSPASQTSEGTCSDSTSLSTSTTTPLITATSSLEHSQDLELQREANKAESTPNQGILELGLVQAEETSALHLLLRDPAPDGSNNSDCTSGQVSQNISEPPRSEDRNEATDAPSPSFCSSITQAQDSKESDSASQQEGGESETCYNPGLIQTSSLQRAVKTKSTKAVFSTASKLSNQETRRVSKQDPKTVKAKVASRPTRPTAKPSNESNSIPAIQRRAVSRKEAAQMGNGDKRSTLGQAKMVAVLRPIRCGKASPNILKPKSQSTEAKPSVQSQERKTAVPNGTLSSCISSLGSEVAEQGSTGSPSQAIQRVPLLNRAGPVGEADNTGEGATKDLAIDYSEGGQEDRKKTPENTATKVPLDKHRAQRTRVSSKLGPGARQQQQQQQQQAKGTRGDKGAPGASCTSGPGPGAPGEGSPGPRSAQTDGSVSGKNGGSTGAGSPARTRQNQSQSQGIPKPRTAPERNPGSTAPNTVASNHKATPNPFATSGGRPAATSGSKLPVKGLPTSLSSSSLGSCTSENNGATAINRGPASPGGSGAAGTKAEERPSRSSLPAGTQSPAKPCGTGTGAATSTSTQVDANASANANAPSTAPKVLGTRGRALSLQGRPPATGLKAPAVAGHNSAKISAASQAVAKVAPAVHQGPAKQSQNPLQRSGSAKLGRPNTIARDAVDKNKPRGASAKPSHPGTTAVLPASPGASKLNQPPAAEPAADLLNGNSLPTPDINITTNVNSNAQANGAAPGLGFRARAGSRSSPKTGSRLPSSSACPAAKLDSGGRPAEDVPARGKPNFPTKEQAEKRNQGIQQLRRLLVQGNRRVEALATVIQHLFTEREEALKQKKELSMQLVNLRDELVSSSQCCERLQKEKEEVRCGLEEALCRLEEQHREELSQLEDRLKSFYQTEWDKVHHRYQEEADKYRTLMEQQVEALRSRQEAERKKQEVSHSQEMESLKQQYETSVQELKRVQQMDVDKLDRTLKENEASLSEKIAELSSEKEKLNDKLKAEEERRKRILSDKNLKDSHTVYLEQELDSLKVVLEIKNSQLHQKEKKIMEMDKLVESNVKLEECLTKVQQENEDYKARMDKHAALSKQLSSEQVVLQQTLQKESKVNKRLSMENEELLWKLHNGDLLASPRRLSPTSPFASPRNSTSFPTGPPLSPR